MVTPSPRSGVHRAAWVLLLAATLIARTHADTPRTRVLFIGNSLTYSNDGLWTHFEQLTAGNPALSVQTGRSVFPGAFLKSLWERREPREAIHASHWDVVILQEDLPETRVADFQEYARRFVTDVRQAGGRPVLLMAWAYPRLGWISQAEIARAHRAVADALSVEIAPAGIAWERAAAQRPSLELYAADREHPSLAGTYLTTAVLYATVFNANPETLAYVPRGLAAADAAFLRSIAWESLRLWRAGP